ncbi:MAG: redoxin domain-containing protein [Pirellulales bacterium]
MSDFWQLHIEYNKFASLKQQQTRKCHDNESSLMLRKLDRRTICSFIFAGSLMPLKNRWCEAQTSEVLLSRVEASNTRVPQLLLPLTHAAEVQQELGLKGDKLTRFEKGLRELDRRWWPARIQPIEKQRTVVAELEKQLEAGISKIVEADKLNRLHQIQLQAQSSRALGRSDVKRLIGLSNLQVDKLNVIFDKNDKLGNKINPSKPDADLEAAYQSAKKAEPTDCLELLTQDQIAKFAQLAGPKFDTLSLSRIFPFAPELCCNDESVGDDRVQLSTLTGKVLLIHFYAFQCSNCHANFPHYKRWSSSLTDKGVKVIGIQTPETQEEKNLEKVLAAAKKQGFNFPVIFDQENKNWDAWGNTMWPTVYVVDKRGYIRFWWQGELNYNGATGDKQIEKLVDQLLKEV